MPTKVSEMKVTNTTETTIDALRFSPLAASLQTSENLIAPVPRSGCRRRLTCCDVALELAVVA